MTIGALQQFIGRRPAYPNLTHEGTLTAAEFRRFRAAYAKADHEALAMQYADAANVATRAYDRMADGGMVWYGRPEGWPSKWTAGVLNNAWPEELKDRLRATLREQYDLRTLATLHWRAAGRRGRLTFAVGRYYA